VPRAHVIHTHGDEPASQLMSAYRDGLRPDARERYDAAAEQVAQVLAEIRYERDMLAATDGPRAVAEAAWYPGHPLGTVVAIQAHYEQLQVRARRDAARTKRAPAHGDAAG